MFPFHRPLLNFAEIKAKRKKEKKRTPANKMRLQILHSQTEILLTKLKS